MKKLLIAILLLFAFSCRIDTGILMLTNTEYPSKPKNYNMQVFLEEKPTKPYKKIAMLEGAKEKDDDHSSAGVMADIIEKLKKEGKEIGADAIIILVDSNGVPLTGNDPGSVHIQGYAIVWE